MTHNTNTTLTRLHSLLLAFFGDETLHFHSARLSNFFTSAFTDAEFDDDNDDNTPPPSIPNLLHTHNDLHRLLDAAHLLHQLMPLTPQPRQSIFKQLKSIRPLLISWNDFPSHLHPHEWCKPETILDEFFTLQAIDAWKDSLNGLFQSAIGEGSPFTSLTEKQIGYVVLMLHRLQDAIWLLHITERIPKADDRDETGRQEDRSPYITTKTRTVHHPLFIISNSSLQRIDLQEIICAISMNDQVQIHTSTGIYKPMISINQIKDILPEKEFIWINQYLAITTTLSNCLPN